MATLFIVGTPIGNLEDASPRTLRVLREVALIAAEDTRVTRQLLSRFDIHTPLVAYTDAYERQKSGRQLRVLDELTAGRDVALVSDAGMPGLADPGYELIRAALDAGHQVVVIPGPSAITTALLASGLPTDRFLFVGFLPRRRADRLAVLGSLAEEPGTLVAFESPHRLRAALADLLAQLGDRPVAVARELTKRFEEIWRGKLSDAVLHYTQEPVKGEVTLVVGGAQRQRIEGAWPADQVQQAIDLLAAEGLAPAAVARVVARLSGHPRNDVYEIVLARKGQGS